MSGLDVVSGTAGLISLGINVCQGLIWYYNAWGDWESDVRDTVQELEETSNFLELVKVRIDKLSQKQADVGTYDKPFQDLWKHCKGTPPGIEHYVIGYMAPAFPQLPL